MMLVKRAAAAGFVCFLLHCGGVLGLPRKLTLHDSNNNNNSVDEFPRGFAGENNNNNTNTDGIPPVNCSSAATGEASPLGIDYDYALLCPGGGLDAVPKGVAYMLLVIEAALLLFFLGDTADEYFSPVLGVMCEQLGIGEDLAGVTFLAFGNGAPDVFSSIAAFSHGDSSPDLGLGALFGAGVFVQTVVLGCVCVVADVTVAPAAFLRDLAFFALTVSLILIWGWNGLDITLGHACSFVAIYALYVCVVLCFEARAKRAARRKRGNVTEEDEERREANRTGRVMSAFWRTPDMESSSSSPPPGNRPKSSSNEEYSFITMPSHEIDLAEEDETEDELAAMIGDELGIELLSPGKQQRSDSSAGAPALAAFGGAIIRENHYSESMGEEMKQQENDANSEWFRSVSDGSRERTVLSSMAQGLLGDRGHSSSAMQDRLDSRRPSIWNGLYWKHLRWKYSINRARRSGAMQVGTSTQASRARRCLRIFAVPARIARLPITILRALTIPAPEPRGWSKSLAMLHPIFSTAFLLFSLGLMRVGSFPLWAILLPVGCLLSVCVHFTTHTSKPPTSPVYSFMFLMTAFFACIGWIYLFAGELVAVLKALGIALGIDQSILGLTILAWGNSVGDLLSNIAVARVGYAEMAVAGCFGAPLFNLLIGLGVSLLILAAQSEEHKINLQLDAFAKVGAIMLLICILSHATVIVASKFHVPRKFAVALIFFYIGFTAVNVLVVTGAIHVS